MDNALQELQDWYAKHCNGEWEHQYGLVTRLYTPIADNVDDLGVPQGDRWMSGSIKDSVWEGAGDETKLPIIKMFLAWAVAREPQ